MTSPSGYAAMGVMLLISIAVFPVLAVVTLFTKGPRAVGSVAIGMVNSSKTALEKASTRKK